MVNHCLSYATIIFGVTVRLGAGPFGERVALPGGDELFGGHGDRRMGNRYFATLPCHRVPVLRKSRKNSALCRRGSLSQPNRELRRVMSFHPPHRIRASLLVLLAVASAPEIARAASCDSKGKIFYLGNVANESRSVWVSATSGGDFHIEAKNAEIDRWSRAGLTRSTPTTWYCGSASRVSMSTEPMYPLQPVTRIFMVIFL